MKIGNFTPHDINIIDPALVTFKSGIRKYVVNSADYTILHSIPSNGMLSVSFEEVIGVEAGLPCKVKRVVGFDPIPEEFDLAIVSGLYASFVDDTRVRSIIDPVFDQEGKKVVGCLFIGKVEK